MNRGEDFLIISNLNAKRVAVGSIAWLDLACATGSPLSSDENHAGRPKKDLDGIKRVGYKNHYSMYGQARSHIRLPLYAEQKIPSDGYCGKEACDGEEKQTGSARCSRRNNTGSKQQHNTNRLEDKFDVLKNENQWAYIHDLTRQR